MKVLPADVGGEGVRECLLNGWEVQLPAENGFFEPFVYKNDHFAKTGSGQT
jgi:hypothetical protein